MTSYCRDAACRAIAGEKSWPDLRCALIWSSQLTFKPRRFIPVSGHIADRLGVRVVFCSAVAIFTSGSAWCGNAPNLPVLVPMQVTQVSAGR